MTFMLAKIKQTYQETQCSASTGSKSTFTASKRAKKAPKAKTPCGVPVHQSP
ncbi:hypothetical protein DSO57_1027553 [Entomophthora muscae]|uniref:Uncharacterized protein n=1 Tax=Entomophthora muscae TaxID=34485 RepID=A0ACC2TP83_9FUNG|nr:hypothetical protein DSO57_1027553 [Entomophthora muscae]